MSFSANPVALREPELVVFKGIKPYLSTILQTQDSILPLFLTETPQVFIQRKIVPSDLSVIILPQIIRSVPLRKLRTINLLVLITFVLSISVGVYAQEEDRPDFSLIEYKSGKQQSFKDILTTRVNVMVVTSTTCGSCISELRAMDWIRAKYKSDMSVTAVFVDRGGESRVYRYLEYYKFDLDRFLVDPGGAVPSRFNAPTVPTMIMFDKKGNERFRKVGFTAGDESIIISQAEEIMYGKRKGEGRRAKGAEKATEEAQAATEQGAPGVRKTTGCASTG